MSSTFEEIITQITIYPLEFCDFYFSFTASREITCPIPRRTRPQFPGPKSLQSRPPA